MKQTRYITLARLTLLFTVLAFAPSLRAALVGPFNVGATATSATLVSGGALTSFGWLNIVNTPLTLSQALTDATIIDTGFANVPQGTVFEFGFEANIAQNNSGGDLVPFVAFDTAPYVISTSFDGFASEFTLPASAFLDTGLTRSYFYQYNDNGPFAGAVLGANIDLSSVGVPSGMSVSAIRIRAVAQNGSGDPLGMAVLVPEPSSAVLLILSASLAALRRKPV